MFATVALAPTAALIAGSALSRLYTWPELRRTRTELADARRLAEYDPLTGLPNRAGAHRRHRQEIAAGRPPAAVLLDLDGFKAVNDTWGHPAGDAHLAEIAERLAESCAPIGALASRLAGDEFLLLMPHSGEHTVLAHVRAILARLGMPLPLPTSSGATITTTPSASAGIALPESGDTWDAQLRRADIALYHAKAVTGHAVLHTRDMRHPAPAVTSGGPRLREHAVSIPQRTPTTARPPVPNAILRTPKPNTAEIFRPDGRMSEAWEPVPTGVNT